MKRIALISVACLLGLLATWSAFRPSMQSQVTLVVDVSNPEHIGDLIALAKSAGLPELHQIGPLPLLQLGLAERDVTAAMDTLSASPWVKSVARSALLSTSSTPNDPLFRDYQWDLRRLNMEAAWDITSGDPLLVIAVLDTGVDRGHPDLSPNLMDGYDFLNDDPDPSDDGTHGTHVAGIIAALGNNNEGISGMAPRVRILPVKVLDSQGLGPDVAVAKGIVYAVEQGARVINVSSGTPFPSAALKESIEFAERRGAVVVAAAGNSADKENAVMFPAAYPQVLAVGALDERDGVPAFSQRQSYVSIAAPGVNIASTIWRAGNGGLAYGSGTGTSAAAPHVSALAGLLWSVDAGLSNVDIRRIITETAEDVGAPGRDDSSGLGRINPLRALRSVADAAGAPRTEPRSTAVPAESPAPSTKPTTTPLKPVAPPPSGGPSTTGPRQWLFADGTSRNGAETRLALFNPGDSAIPFRVTLRLTDGRTVRQSGRVEAASRVTMKTTDIAPDADFSIAVDADDTLFVERTIRFGHDVATLAGQRSASTSWFFAEGSADNVYQTSVVIANLESKPAQVSIRTFGEGGPQPELPFTVPEGTRVKIQIPRLPIGSEFSTIVTSDVPVVVERGVYFDGGLAGDTNGGTKAPSKVWYFAEGDTREDFDASIALFNPTSDVTTTRIQIFRSEGAPIEQSVQVPGLSRRTVLLDGIVPNERFSLRLESTVPIVAERSMSVGGGSNIASGVTQPATEWLFAEGDTSDPFTESLAFLNSNDDVANVEISFFQEGGRPTQTQTIRIAGRSRGSFDVSRALPAARSSIRVSSDKGIVVERTMYLDDRGGGTSGPGITR